MILQSLCSYYDRVTETADASMPTDGFSSEKAHFALVINKSGTLEQIRPLTKAKGARKIPQIVIVPQGSKKSVNIAASFLWGNTSYVLGADEKGKPQRTAACHEAFKELHDELLNSNSDEGGEAVLAFLSSWNPEKAKQLVDWQTMHKGNLVFQLDGDRQFVHERPEMQRVWLASLASVEKNTPGMCLVSGEVAPLARLHPPIKGVTGAQSSGAALVSFNLDAFCSYGKKQNFNAPVAESRAEAYTKALNHLLSPRGNRVQIGDATTVFWTERESPVEGFFGIVIDPRDTAAYDHELAVFLESVRQGKLPWNIDGDVKFYILGLSPNASRLSVRFWHMSTVRDICEKLGQHFRDLSMVRSFDSEPEYPGTWRLLNETSNKKSKDGPSPLLGGTVMQAILNGTLYPQALLSAIIGRIRAEQNINYMRAAIIKAILVRKKRILKQGAEITMALDKENKNMAYRLGRLFAVLEKAQQDAIPGANTTIKARPLKTDSTAPRRRRRALFSRNCSGLRNIT